MKESNHRKNHLSVLWYLVIQSNITKGDFIIFQHLAPVSPVTDCEAPAPIEDVNGRYKIKHITTSSIDLISTKNNQAKITIEFMNMVRYMGISRMYFDDEHNVHRMISGRKGYFAIEKAECKPNMALLAPCCLFLILLCIVFIYAEIRHWDVNR